MEADYTEISKIVLLAVNKFTDRGFFDYFAIILPSLITIIALLQSVYFYRQSTSLQSKQYIAEKELTRFYDALDCFFSFSDKAGLFFSLKKYEYSRIANKKQIENSFRAKIDDANSSVTDSFKDVEKTIFILHSIGLDELADEVNVYKTSIVSFRSTVINYESSGTYEGYQISELEFSKVIEAMATSFKEWRSSLLIKIHSAQELLLTNRLR